MFLWISPTLTVVHFGAAFLFIIVAEFIQRKQKTDAFVLVVAFRGEMKALHLLKGRQYSILCQNRIRLELKPCQRKMLHFAYTANLFSSSQPSYNIICSV